MRRVAGRFVALALVLASCQGSAGQELDPGARRPYEADLEVVTRVEVPEVYELANIAIGISPYGRDDPYAVHKEGEYYERVMAWFEPHAEHPLVVELQSLIERSYRNYYGFRENAFSYRFDDDGELDHGGEYHEIWRSPDLFSESLRQVQDFAEQSGFREFFAQERDTYADQVERYRALVDLPAMAGWLHDRFPGLKYDAYTVVFSPLIRGSHSARWFDRRGRREAVMFIAGPDLPVGDVDDEVRAALHARVVFTEIDHSFVNPVTDQHRRQLDEAFLDWEAWNTGENYRSAYATFNEYMTWAVFTLFAADTYSPAAFAEAVERSERQMALRRGFVRFREFNRELLRLYREHPEVSLPELYDPMLRWLAATDRLP